jgi:hypothetical protein
MQKTLDRGLNIQTKINCSHQSVLLHSCFLSSILFLTKFSVIYSFAFLIYSIFNFSVLRHPQFLLFTSLPIFMFCFPYILLISRHVLTLDPDLFFSLMPTCLLILYSSCSYVLLFRYSPAIPLFSTPAVFLSRRFPISSFSYLAVYLFRRITIPPFPIPLHSKSVYFSDPPLSCSATL